MSPRSVSRRAFLGTAGAADARRGRSLVGRRHLVRASARGRAAAPTGSTPSVPFEGAAPGGDRHAGAGPAAVRVVRRDHRRPRRLVRAAARSGRDASRRMTAGQLVGTDNDDQDAPPDDTGEAVGLGPVVAHAHVRVRRVAVRPRRAIRSASRRASRPRSRRCRCSRGDEIRPRDQRRRPRDPVVRRTTRPSCSTRSATSPASGAASSRCGGRSRASGARRSPTTSR